MATLTITPIKTFTSGETVTPAKLNELSQSTVALTAGTIVDADVSASAAIAPSKLGAGALPAAVTVASANLVDGTIVDADVSATAAVALSKLATGALPTAITVATANIVDANVTPAKLSQPLTLATAQNTTSGTSIDFTPANGNGIPSWAKRITVMLNGVSTSGTSALLIQLGTSSGVTTSGYTGGGMSFAVSSLSGITTTAGIPLTGSMLAGNTYGGTAVIANTSSNSWAGSGSLGGGPTISAGNGGGFGSGSIALASTLDRIRLTTVNGTDTFDAGSANIMYEG
jgi:hypothetical protein